MKNRVETTGATIDEAIEKALIELNITKEEADITIVQEPNKGFLGIGAKDAQVIVAVKNDSDCENENDNNNNDENEYNADIAEEANAVAEEPIEAGEAIESEAEQDGAPETEEYYETINFNKDAENIALSFLKDVFEKMKFNISPEVDREASAENEVYIRLVGADVGITIGRRGETLDALQYLSNLAVSRKLGMGTKVVLDVENYREKRRDTLVLLAERLEKKVLRTGRRVELEPMNPYERRIIHATLQASRQVETYSEGEEPNRYVVVDLKGRRRD